MCVCVCVCVRVRVCVCVCVCVCVHHTKVFSCVSPQSSMQFFLSSDGTLSTALEHSSADGTTAIQISNFAFKYW